MLFGKGHPLKEWAVLPTPLSEVVLTNAEADAADAAAAADTDDDTAFEDTSAPPPLPTAAAAASAFSSVSDDEDEEEEDIYSDLSEDSGDYSYGQAS